MSISDAYLRQYIFLRIGVYSMLKYPVQARQYKIENFHAGLGFIECLAVSDH